MSSAEEAYDRFAIDPVELVDIDANDPRFALMGGRVVTHIDPEINGFDDPDIEEADLDNLIDIGVYRAKTAVETAEEKVTRERRLRAAKHSAEIEEAIADRSQYWHA